MCDASGGHVTGGGGGIVDARAGEECRAQRESMEGWGRRVGTEGSGYEGARMARAGAEG